MPAPRGARPARGLQQGPRPEARQPSAEPAPQAQQHAAPHEAAVRGLHHRAELQQVQTLLYKIADSSLLEIYVDNADPQKPVYDSAEHMESEFTKQALRGGGGRQAHGARAPRRALPPGRHVASGDDAFRGPRARACVACAPLRTHAATCSGGAHTRGWPARRLYTSTRKRNVPLVASCAF